MSVELEKRPVEQVEIPTIPLEYEYIPDRKGKNLLLMGVSFVTGVAVTLTSVFIWRASQWDVNNVLEVAQPSYEINVQGEEIREVTWVQLDQLRTYNNGFRQGFDEVFNINLITQGDLHGKSGVLYVNANGERDGNTTMEDAFRNRTFATQYWGDNKVRNEIISLADNAYTDLNSGSSENLLASFNAYYNLMQDAENPNSYNGSQSLSREQFYTLVFKASNPVRNLEYDENGAFTQQVGGMTEYTRYAEQVAGYDFLGSSLDEANIGGAISRAEAIYMVVSMHFPDLLEEANPKDNAFSDTKNAGNIALKQKFATQDKSTKEITYTDGYQSYVLAYMLQNPNKGLDEEFYKAMVVAHDLGLIQGEESRWDESISKSEAIHLMASTFIAKNNVYGYRSEAEYGTADGAIIITEDGSNENITSEFDLGQHAADVAEAEAEARAQEKLEEEMEEYGLTEEDLQSAPQEDTSSEQFTQEEEDYINAPVDIPDLETVTPPAPPTPKPDGNGGGNQGDTGGTIDWSSLPGFTTDPGTEHGGNNTEGVTGGSGNYS